MSSIIAFAPLYNTKGRRDATGAFRPEAEAFCRAHSGELVLVDNRLPRCEMRGRSYARLGERSPAFVQTLAFFCHGSRDGIQFGFDKSNIRRLAQWISAESNVRVVLYCCSTGSSPSSGVGGDGGFADALRDALCRAGAVNCQVDAHTTAGHTTRNPFVRRFLGMGSRVGGVGGFWIVSPTNKPLWAKWRRALRDTDLRFEFSFLSVAEIHERLMAG